MTTKPRLSRQTLWLDCQAGPTADEWSRSRACRRLCSWDKARVLLAPTAIGGSREGTGSQWAAASIADCLGCSSFLPSASSPWCDSTHSSHLANDLRQPATPPARAQIAVRGGNENHAVTP